ncbi:MAE_28990/MAE_18760 family HEPN-like nuclease [Faecalimonas sp. LCP19S3_D12]
MKIEQFEDFIQEDLAWRKMEISQLFRILNTAESKEVVTKSIVLLLYAHWEGFLKKSFKYYLKYVSECKIKIKDLTLNFKAIVLKKYAHECIDNDSLNLSKEMQFINAQDKMDNKRFKIKIDVENDLDEDIINTKHNLNSKVLKNICDIVGIKYNNSMKARSAYVDAILLKHRNSIGHAGKMAKDDTREEEMLSFDDVQKLKNFVLIMLDYYAKVLVDYTEREFYLASNDSERAQYEEEQENYLSSKLDGIERKKDMQIQMDT